MEKMFAYIPQGCQIVSIDVFQAEETPLEVITGLIILFLDHLITGGSDLKILCFTESFEPRGLGIESEMIVLSRAGGRSENLRGH